MNWIVANIKWIMLVAGARVVALFIGDRVSARRSQVAA